MADDSRVESAALPVIGNDKNCIDTDITGRSDSYFKLTSSQLLFHDVSRDNDTPPNAFPMHCVTTVGISGLPLAANATSTNNC